MFKNVALIVALVIYEYINMTYNIFMTALT